MLRAVWGFILFLFVLTAATAVTQVVILSLALRPDGVVAFAVFAALFVIGLASLIRIFFGARR